VYDAAEWRVRIFGNRKSPAIKKSRNNDALSSWSKISSEEENKKINAWTIKSTLRELIPFTGVLSRQGVDAIQLALSKTSTTFPAKTTLLEH